MISSTCAGAPLNLNNIHIKVEVPVINIFLKFFFKDSWPSKDMQSKCCYLLDMPVGDTFLAELETKRVCCCWLEKLWSQTNVFLLKMSLEKWFKKNILFLSFQPLIFMSVDKLNKHTTYPTVYLKLVGHNTEDKKLRKPTYGTNFAPKCGHLTQT